MTIFWALQLTQISDLHTIIMEGDAKICFDALNLGLLNFEWSTSVPLNNAVEISRSIDSGAFCWVRRRQKVFANRSFAFCPPYGFEGVEEGCF